MTHGISSRLDTARHRLAPVKYGFLNKISLIRAALNGDKEAQFHLLRQLGMRHVVVQVNGYRIRISLDDNIIGKWIFMHGPWEPCETKLMIRLLRPGATFIDVGAHIGYYSLLAASIVGCKGRVFSFEPSPNNFRLLKGNVRMNGYSEIIAVENLAVSTQNERLSLYLSEYNTGDHRVYATTEADDIIFNASKRRKAFVTVPSIRLDDYLPKHGILRIDAIKIDVQGAELSVLLGLKETLRRSARVLLFIEFWPYGLLSYGTEPQDLLNLLTDEIGLSLYQIALEHERVIPIERASFSSYGQNFDPQKQVDLIACRGLQSIPNELLI